jgi:hypothetical protein
MARAPSKKAQPAARKKPTAARKKVATSAVKKPDDTSMEVWVKSLELLATTTTSQAQHLMDIAAKQRAGTYGPGDAVGDCLNMVQRSLDYCTELTKLWTKDWPACAWPFAAPPKSGTE